MNRSRQQWKARGQFQHHFRVRDVCGNSMSNSAVVPRSLLVVNGCGTCGFGDERCPRINWISLSRAAVFKRQGTTRVVSKPTVWMCRSTHWEPQATSLQLSYQGPRPWRPRCAEDAVLHTQQMDDLRRVQFQDSCCGFRGTVHLDEGHIGRTTGRQPWQYILSGTWRNWDWCVAPKCYECGGFGHTGQAEWRREATGQSDAQLKIRRRGHRHGWREGATGKGHIWEEHGGARTGDWTKTRTFVVLKVLQGRSQGGTVRCCGRKRF